MVGKASTPFNLTGTLESQDALASTFASAFAGSFHVRSAVAHTKTSALSQGASEHTTLLFAACQTPRTRECLFLAIGKHLIEAADTENPRNTFLHAPQFHSFFI